jgi:hypothetical protein
MPIEPLACGRVFKEIVQLIMPDFTALVHWIETYL